MDAGDGAELHGHRVVAHAFDAVDVDMRAEREHERIELDPLVSHREHAASVIEPVDLTDAQLDAGAADERRQAPVADVLPCRPLMQSNALDESIGGADERDGRTGGYAPRQPQCAADACVARARDDDAMWVHVCLLDGKTARRRQPVTAATAAVPLRHGGDS